MILVLLVNKFFQRYERILCEALRQQLLQSYQNFNHERHTKELYQRGEKRVSNTSYVGEAGLSLSKLETREGKLLGQEMLVVSNLELRAS